MVLLIALVAGLALALPAAASARLHRPIQPVHPIHHPGHVRVAATVTLDQPSGALTTATPISFSGVVSPATAGHRIVLQRQTGPNGDHWSRIDGGAVHSDGTYAIVHRFRQPGDLTLRALLLPNNHTLRSPSTPISIAVEQTQIPGFTINSSAQPIDFGQSVTISGTFTGAANTSLTLFAREEHHGPLRSIATATTDASGNYSFTQSPPHNTVYQVRATTSPQVRSARLFEGVGDVVSISASATSATVGTAVTFSGTVQPSKDGHVVYLQRLDSGVWKTIVVARAGSGSAYSIPYTLAATGDAQYRTLVPGGPRNQRGVSSAVQVTANPSS